MCRMVSQALLHASPTSNKAFHETLKASEASFCSFLPPSKPRGLRMSQHSISSTITSSRKPVPCHASSSLAKQERDLILQSCNLDQESPSPDRWVKDCVCDIVRNIDEAPFLHMLFDSKGSSAVVRSQRQKVVRSDTWNIEDKWSEVKDIVSKTSPDGVILVHHLDDEALEGCCLRDGSYPALMKSSNTEANGSKDTTKLWGVLVLSKSISRSGCYILKTTSMASSFGTCTQFCLTKAQCFGPSWHEQLQTSWLLSAESNDHNNQH